MLFYLPKAGLPGSHFDRYAVLAFWASVAVIAYTYAGYPLLLWVLTKLRRPRPSEPSTAPSITILICAHNEARNIGKKLTDCLALNYPHERLQIVVASDGSTDETVQIVRSFSDQGVGLVVIPQQRGKTNAQNVAVQYATGDIVVFSDATTEYQADALQYIAGNFADPAVGAVSGRYYYFDPEKESSFNSGAQAFAGYDNGIRKMQSELASITGCCGCIYAVRRSLYTPLQPHIISDLVEPMHVLLQGAKVKLEPRAVARESTANTSRKEFSMRVRVITRALHGISSVGSLLSPWRHPWIALQLYSHKLLRYGVPIFLLGALLSSFLLIHIPLYRFIFVAQAFFYAVALLTAFVPAQKLARPLALPLYFCIVNAAALAAIIQFARGERYVSWRPEREVSRAH